MNTPYAIFVLLATNLISGAATAGTTVQAGNLTNAAQGRGIYTTEQVTTAKFASSANARTVSFAASQTGATGRDWNWNIAAEQAAPVEVSNIPVESFGRR